MQTVLGQTDKVKHDKIFRLQSKIQSRKDYMIGAITYSEARNDKKQLIKLDKFVKQCDSLYNRLVIIYNNYQHQEYLDIYREVNTWSNRKVHLLDLFGIHQSSSRSLNKTLTWCLEYLSESAKQTSINITSERLRLEFYDKLDKGWFMVFSTLTVDPDHYEKVFSKGSDCWRNYIRKIQRKVAAQCYGSWRKAKGQHYFSYFAVVEEGGETDRLHIHSLMFMKSSIDLTDPNAGLAIPHKREIKGLTHLWEYGFSTHTPVRWNNTDSWAKKDWRWAVEFDKELNTWQPIQNSTVGKMCGYLIKYVMKSKKVKLKGEIYSWKIKMSKDLGKHQINKVINQLNDQQLLTLIAPRKYPSLVKMYGEPVISKLIRQIAVKQLLKRHPRLPVLPKDTTLRTLLRNTTRKKCDHKLQSFGDSVLTLMNNKVTFDIEEFYRVKKILEADHQVKSDTTETSGANPVYTI